MKKKKGSGHEVIPLAEELLANDWHKKRSGEETRRGRGRERGILRLWPLFRLTIGYPFTLEYVGGINCIKCFF